MSSDGQKSRTTVEIYDQQYKIVGDESTSHIRLVASIVDDKMRKTKDRYPFLDTKRLAVLTAVNIVSESIKLEEEVQKLKLQLKQYEEGNAND